MKKPLPLTVQPLVLFGLALLHSFGLDAAGLLPENATPFEKATTQLGDPPQFSNVPDDVTVSCVSEVLPAPALMATDDDDPDFPMMIPAADDPDPATIGCAGGVITRSWTAMDDEGNSTTVTQTITIEPDSSPPAILIDEPSDTLNCEEFSQAAWVTWLDSKELTLATQIDECNIDRIENDAPATFDTYCGSITVVFTVFDECGFSSEWNATLTVVDLLPPVLTGVPTENDTISCAEPVPPAPLVTATDNCTVDLTINFNEATGQANDGSCSEYDYVIIRSWSVVDSCGNLTTAIHRIVVTDNMSPTFTRPPDITISCTDDPSDLNLTGAVTDAADNCDPTVEVSFSDTQIPNPGCPQGYAIQRVWLAEDACGNATGKLQLINVVDNEAPSFNVPGDLMLQCGQSTDPSFTGQPDALFDNCDPEPEVSFSDVVTQGACVNEFSIERTWEVRDACGNFTMKTQSITVSDQSPPAFSATANDLDVVCSGGQDIAAIFTDWWMTRGGAAASDDCTLAADLVWTIRNSGSDDLPTLPPPVCPSEPGILRSQTVDFIVEDECGNRDTTTATFRLLDSEAPVLTECPADQTIPADPGVCEAIFTLQPPVIVDACGSGTTPIIAVDSAAVTSSAPPGQQSSTPVDAVALTLPIAHPLPINAAGDGLLRVRLLNADAEGETEFLNILGEDGALLGRTGRAPGSCLNSDTTLAIPAASIAAWSADGAITIHLEPNIPNGLPGSFSVNAICPGGTNVQAELSFTALDFLGLRYAYRVDDGPLTPVDPVGPVDVVLEQGPHSIVYYASDCAGNIDSCGYQVTVADQEPPVLDCPDDQLLSLPQAACTIDVALPFPEGAADNCGVGSLFDQTRPADTADARLTFAFDPNLNRYQAQGKTYVFNGLTANAGGEVILTVSLLGDFDTNGAFFEVYGDDGNLMGVTPVGVATCTSAGQATFAIPQLLYNEWAADGSIAITLLPNEIAIPPGVPGDGINPCDPGMVTFDGDTDGLSYAFVRLAGQALTPAYYAEGASPIPLTPYPVLGGAPTHTFEPGITTVFYLIDDAAGNADTCSYDIEVRDEEAPVALCQPTTIFINPGGTVDPVVPAEVIDNSSFDNCAIDTMYLAPDTFNCIDDGGQIVDVTLFVEDAAGNSATCETFVRVELEEPEPTSNAADGLCAGDTLCLQANPPPAPGGIVYTYQWSGPDDFSSNSPNPCITNITTENAGTYTVTITGITGCSVSGTVSVPVLGLPGTPEVITDENICIDEDIELVSSVSPAGDDVSYRWYRGVPGNSVFLAETSEAAYSIPGPHNIPMGSNTITVRYFLEVQRDGCFSETSPPVTITISRIPVAEVNQPQVVLCEGEAFAPGTPVTGQGITYQWTGPDDYNATSQNPPVVNPVTPDNAGPYVLTVLRNGCPSEPDTTLLTVIPKPPTPQIFNNGPACVGEEILLSTDLTGATSYQWRSSASPDIITTSTNTLLLPDLTLGDAASWEVRVLQAGCLSDFSASTNIIIFAPPPTVAGAADESVCEADTIRLQAMPNVPTYTYEWTGPEGFSSLLPNPVIGNNVDEDREGHYVLTVTTDAGCSRADSIYIDIVPGVSILGLSNDGQDCLPGPTDVQLVSAVFPPDDGTYEYIWTPPSPATMVQPDPECLNCAVIPDATEADNGIYRLVVRTGDGCSSEFDTTLVDISLPPATPGAPQVSDATPAPFCEGEPITLTTDPVQAGEVIYYWQLPDGELEPTTMASLNILNANEVEDEGLYSLRVSVDGCLSAESPEISINIRPVPDVTPATNGPLCSGDTLSLSTAIVPGATYSWTGPNGFSSSLANPRIPGADTSRSGYYFIQAELNGCFSTVDSVQAMVNPRPATPALSNNGPLCIDQGAALLELSVAPGSATPGATYAWYLPSGELITEMSGLTLAFGDFSGFVDGEYPFSVQGILGNCTTERVTTPVVLNTIPGEPAFAGADTTLCEADMLQLTAAAPGLGSGLWSSPPGNPPGLVLSDPGDPNSGIEGLIGGETYTLIWTLSNGACQNYDQDSVNLSITPAEIPRAGDDRKWCINEEIRLEATPTSTGVGIWSQPSEQGGLGVDILDPTDPNTRVTGLDPDNTYIFTWSIESGCGAGEDDVIIVISDPTPDAGRDTIVCNDDGLVRLNADAPTLGSSGRWSTDDPNVLIDNPNSPTALVTNLTQGDNIFFWTIDDGLCGQLSVDEVTVTRKDRLIALDDEFTVPFGEPVTLSLLDNDQFTPGVTTIIILTPDHGDLEAIETGSYIYRPDISFAGEDQFRYELCSEGCGCVRADVILNVGQDAACEVPNVITPNQDGVNDVFVVPCLLNADQFPQSQVKIFNRWGDQVYESAQPYTNDWDGTFDGEDLPVGTYFYIIEYGEEREADTGFIMIQR